MNLVNDGAVARNDFYITGKDTALSVAAPGLLGNDNDADIGQSTLTALLVSGPSNAATFTLNADGSFIYSPAPISPEPTASPIKPTTASMIATRPRSRFGSGGK